MRNEQLSSHLRNLVVGTETKVPLLNGRYVTAINFDNAATTPPLSSVMEEINNFVPWYSSIHRGKGYKSVLSSNVYEDARKVVADFVGADESKDAIIFTKNTTESINILAYTLFQENREQIILSTDMEHLANDLPWRSKFKVDFVKTDAYGRLSLEDLERKLSGYKGKVKLVTVTGASNVTGFINPIHKIARLAHKYGAKILVDGAQLVPHAPFNMLPYDAEEHIDYLAFSAHKMYAPFGIGVLIGPKETFEKGTPTYQGGGAVRLVSHQFIEWDSPPAKDEAGTPNVIGALALVASIKTLDHVGMKVIDHYERELIGLLIEGLKTIPGLTLYSHANSEEKRVSLISFNIEDIPHYLLAEMLSHEGGIAVRNGLFCAHPYGEKLLKLTDKELEYYHKNHDVHLPGMVRASLGLYNNAEEINRFVDRLSKIVRRKTYFKSKYERIFPKLNQKLTQK